MEQCLVVHMSGGSVERGDLTPDREAVGHLGSSLARAEQMPSRPKVCGDAAEGGQESLGMPQRFEAFHRPFTLFRYRDRRCSTDDMSSRWATW